MPFISSSELCSRIKALYRKTWYLNNPFHTVINCSICDSHCITENQNIVIPRLTYDFDKDNVSFFHFQSLVFAIKFTLTWSFYFQYTSLNSEEPGLKEFHAFNKLRKNPFFFTCFDYPCCICSLPIGMAQDEFKIQNYEQARPIALLWDWKLNFCLLSSRHHLRSLEIT